MENEYQLRMTGKSCSELVWLVSNLYACFGITVQTGNSNHHTEPIKFRIFFPLAASQPALVGRPAVNECRIGRPVYTHIILNRNFN